MNKTLRTVLIAGGTIIALLILSSLIPRMIPGWEYRNWGMMSSGMMGGFAGMAWMSIAWIVILGLVVWAIVTMAGGTSRSGGHCCKTDSVSNLLKHSYVKGEISKEEYIDKENFLSLINESCDKEGNE